MSTRAELQQRLERQDRAIRTLAWWLAQAQTGFGVLDARGIDNILDGNLDGVANQARAAIARAERVRVANSHE